MATICYDTSSGTTSAASVWLTWATADSTGGTATTQVSNEAIWTTWTTTSSATNIPNPAASTVWVDVTRPTAEQIREMAEQEQRLADERKQRDLAAAKAQELLRANLSQRQRDALDKHGWLLVEGGKSKKTYRVHSDRCAGNIIELDGAGKQIARYCVHADYTIPLGDQLLAQVLSLQHDEDHIIGKANKTPLAA